MFKYFNFNYASDKQNQKLILEYIYMFKDESMLWTSQKQKFIIILTTETEYIIMSMCAKIEIWLEQILRNININKYFEVNSHYINI